ncbi:MAG: protein TolQ, partial [Pseudomonadota bacterium]
MIYLQAEGLSLFELLADADAVVWVVLIILLLASAISWGVIFEKLFSLPSLAKKSRQFEADFWAGQADTNAAGDKNAAANVFAAASREWDKLKGPSLTPEEADAMVARAGLVMQATVDQEIAQAGRWNGFLASVSSAS